VITLLGAALGLFSSVLPDVLGLFRESADNKHELAILEIQVRRDVAAHGFKMEEIMAQADVREVEAIHREFAQRKETWKWIEALISSVRPVITYAFFGLYAAVKWAQLELATRATGEVVLALPAVWHETDMALFATIIAFWFGQRAMRHWRKGS
jgi:hypothetical protein